jgi:hypothetical protein
MTKAIEDTPPRVRRFRRLIRPIVNAFVGLLNDIRARFKHRLADGFALLVIWVFYATNIVFWEMNNKRLIAFDEVGHFFDSVIVARILQSPSLLLNVPQFLAYMTAQYPMFLSLNIYPPFVYAVTSLFYFVMLPSLPLASSTSIIFLLVLILSVYGLANELLGRGIGLFAAFLVCGYPVLVGISRIYYLEFPLAAMVALTLYLLVRTRHFQNRRTVLALSVALIAGMLTKQTFPLYVSGPLAYEVLKSLRNKVAFKNLILCAAISSISVAYYFVLKPGGFGVYFAVYGAVPALRGDLYQPYSWLRVLETLTNYDMGIPLALLFGAGIFEVIRACHNRGFIVSGLILPVVLLAIVEPFYPYEPRFPAPILPLAAVASAAAFSHLNRRNQRQLLALIIVVGFVLAQYASITYSSPIFAGIYPNAPDPAYGLNPPSNQDWRISQILHEVQLDAMDRGIRRPSLVVLAESNYFFDDTLFYYYAYVGRINVTMYYNGYYSPSEGIKSVCTANYVVTRANVSPNELQGKLAQNVAEVNAFVQEHIGNFTLIGNYSLPDGSIASLLWRNPTFACPLLAGESAQGLLGSEPGIAAKDDFGHIDQMRPLCIL